MRKSVSVVLKNTDFTEGKGSMVIHKVFVAIDNARRYIKTQPGIMQQELILQMTELLKSLLKRST